MNGKKELHAPQHEKSTDNNIMWLLTPSLLGIVACLVCLMGITWAWFSDDGSKNMTHLQAANFTASAEVTQSGAPLPGAGNVWNLTDGTYSVTITAGGTSRTGGYCTVKLGEEVYHTGQIYPETVTEAGTVHAVTFTVTVEPGASVPLSILPQWGTAPTEGNLLEENQTITVPAPIGDPGSEELPGIEENPGPTTPAEQPPTETEESEPPDTTNQETQPQPPAPTEATADTNTAPPNE